MILLLTMLLEVSIHSLSRPFLASVAPYTHEKEGHTNILSINKVATKIQEK